MVLVTTTSLTLTVPRPPAIAADLRGLVCQFELLSISLVMTISLT